MIRYRYLNEIPQNNLLNCGDPREIGTYAYVSLCNNIVIFVYNKMKRKNYPMAPFKHHLPHLACSNTT